MPAPIGYVLIGQDIKTYFYKSAPAGVICPDCNSCLNRSYIPGNVSIPPSVDLGIGYTLDDQPLFSGKLIDIIQKTTTSTFDYIQVSDIPSYFFAIARDQLIFDAERRKTNFGTPCNACGNPKHVTGATPAYLKCSTIAAEGFYRTDLEFGGMAGKSPLFIVGSSLKKRIENESFPGVLFMDACGPPEA